MLNILNGKVLPVMADLSALHHLKAVWGNQLHQFTEGISDTRNSDEVVNETLQEQVPSAVQCQHVIPHFHLHRRPSF